MSNSRTWVNLGRISLVLSFIALIGAWIATQNGSLFNLDQRHLFNDAIVFGLLGIGMLIDAQIHAKTQIHAKK